MKLALGGHEERQRWPRTFGSLREPFADSSEGVGGRIFLTSVLLDRNWLDHSRHAELGRSIFLRAGGLTCFSERVLPFCTRS